MVERLCAIRGSLLVVTAIVLGASFFPGCASHAPEPSDPSTKEIKSDADRNFERMKQEERESRGQGTSPR